MATISDPRAGTPNAAPATSGSSMTGWMPANPAPLGLAGFGLTTLILSVMNANITSFGKELPVVFGMAFAYGGLAQLLAGMWEFRAGNTFGAVAFTSFGAFWISFFFLGTFDLKLIAPAGATSVDSALGLYLWSWGILTGLLFLCTFTAPRAVQAVFLLLTITFVLLGIGNAGGTSSMIHAGGWFGIATAAAALYTAIGEIMTSVYGHDVLPLGRPAPRT